MVKIKLEYLKGSKEMSIEGFDMRMWNVIEPKLETYNYNKGYPTFTILGLKERGLI